MVWAFRIISGLAVMTAPYVWTVGQAGLETANKNICELATALVTLPTCKIHFVYFGVWLFGLAAAILFIIFDAARFMRRAATPHGGIVLFCRHYQAASGRSLRNVWSKVEPSHVIILGLVIAFGGAVWQLRRVPPIDPNIAQLQSQLGDAQKQIALLKSQTDKPFFNSGHPSLPQPPSRRYTSYEKEQRLRAVDEIYGVVVSALTPTYIAGRDLTNNLKAEITGGTVLKNLREQQKKTEVAFSALDASLQKYGYLTDIVNIANSFDHMPALVAFDNLISEIQQLQKTAPDNAQSYIDRNVASIEARNAFTAFERWLEKTKPLLKQKRIELEKSEVMAVSQPENADQPATNPQSAKRTYLGKEKERIDEDITAISTLLNSKGLQAVSNANRVANFFAMPSIFEGAKMDGLIDNVKTISPTLGEIYSAIWEKMLVEHRINSLDLEDVLQSKEPLVNLQTASNRFASGFEQFKAIYVNNGNPEMRQAALMLFVQLKEPLLKSTQEFNQWITDCNSRIEAKRAALRQ
jgi:hypothetical protein